jgi:hypothetical protein
MRAADFTLDALMVLAGVSLIIGWFIKRSLDRDRAGNHPDSKP